MIQWPHVAHFADLVDLRPALEARFQSIHAVIGDTFHVGMLRELFRDFEGELSATPQLAELGFDLLRPGRAEEERRWGGVWLTLFPSMQMVEAMRALLRDPAQPAAVRSQAAWTLGFRQIQERHRDLHWEPEVVRAANAELLHAFRVRALGELELLARALQHVDDPELDAAFLEDPLKAAPAIDAFASPALARALLARLSELGSENAVRMIRLVAAVLGEEATEPLLRFAETAPMAEKYEATFAALANSPERARPVFEALVRSLQFPVLVEARGRWHLEHPGIHPTVAATRFARNSALLSAAERPKLAAEACAHFAALADKDGLLWNALWDFWRHAAYLAVEEAPAEVVRCVEARPDTLDRARFLVRPYLEALAALGRFETLERCAISRGRADEACWMLARAARPFRSLAIREHARVTTPAGAAGQALALVLGGRPDLAQRALEVDRPSTGDVGGHDFPTEDDTWKAAHDAREPYLAPLIQKDLSGLMALLRPAPEGAEPDVFDLDLLTRKEQTLRRDLSGRTACLIGGFDNREEVIARLQEQGAQLVDGPFARTECVIVGALGEGERTRVAMLQSQGVLIVPVSDLLP